MQWVLMHPEALVLSDLDLSKCHHSIMFTVLPGSWAKRRRTDNCERTRLDLLSGLKGRLKDLAISAKRTADRTADHPVIR
jgi:hypothetical protein